MKILSLGRKPYREVWALQRQLHEAVVAEEGPETLILCEHSPVITLGTSAKRENILIPEASLREKGIEVIEIERGGDVTYHGPGQLVGYPILDLRKRKRDIGWYMRSLEQVIINTLQDFEIHAQRVPGKTGVWTQVSENDKDFWGKKIASLGVRISRWCSWHGFSLNVSNCEEGFSSIHPCGFKTIEMSSIAQELGKETPMETVIERATMRFLELFPPAS